MNNTRDLISFKTLVRNDLVEGKGNQSGPLIPKDLLFMFPELAYPTERPSESAMISVSFEDTEGNVHHEQSRYQYQTWGGTRPREYRITGQLGPLLHGADKGDMLLIEGDAEGGDYYLRVLKNGSAAFTSAYQRGRVLARSPKSEWGLIDPDSRELSAELVQQQSSMIEGRLKEAFSLFEDDDGFRTDRRRARKKAFASLVLAAYGPRCAFCGGGLHTPESGEHEAAHIVPHSHRGPDDVRNGLVLCRAHHWAFDAGWLGISPDLTVVVSTHVANLTGLAPLAELKGRPLQLPLSDVFHPHPDATAYHQKHFEARQSRDLPPFP